MSFWERAAASYTKTVTDQGTRKGENPVEVLFNSSKDSLVPEDRAHSEVIAAGSSEGGQNVELAYQRLRDEKKLALGASQRAKAAKLALAVAKMEDMLTGDAASPQATHAEAMKLDLEAGMQRDRDAKRAAREQERQERQQAQNAARLAAEEEAAQRLEQERAEAAAAEEAAAEADTKARIEAAKAVQREETAARERAAAEAARIEEEAKIAELAARERAAAEAARVEEEKKVEEAARRVAEREREAAEAARIREAADEDARLLREKALEAEFERAKEAKKELDRKEPPIEMPAAAAPPPASPAARKKAPIVSPAGLSKTPQRARPASASLPAPRPAFGVTSRLTVPTSQATKSYMQSTKASATPEESTKRPTTPRRLSGDFRTAVSSKPAQAPLLNVPDDADAAPVRRMSESQRRQSFDRLATTGTASLAASRTERRRVSLQEQQVQWSSSMRSAAKPRKGDFVLNTKPQAGERPTEVLWEPKVEPPPGAAKSARSLRAWNSLAKADAPAAELAKVFPQPKKLVVNEDECDSIFNRLAAQSTESQSKRLEQMRYTDKTDAEVFKQSMRSDAVIHVKPSPQAAEREAAEKRQPSPGRRRSSSCERLAGQTTASMRARRNSVDSCTPDEQFKRSMRSSRPIGPRLRT